MRILNREEFFKLPEGTVYSEYDPLDFYGLFIKGEQLQSDYVELELIGNLDYQDSDEYSETLEKARETGNSFKLDFESYDRNGMYSDDQLYAVYEKEDIEGLINVLKTGIPL